MATTKPDLTRIWAAGAPSENVQDPDDVEAGKFNSGWVAEKPPFEYFNFLQKLFTQGLLYISENGVGVWDTNTGYPVGAITKGSNGKLYQCVTEQNGNDPASDDGTNWIYFKIDNPTSPLVDSGDADAYVLTSEDQQEVLTYVDGQEFLFTPLVANIGGAATVDVDGLGVIAIKLKGGTANPEANDIDPSRRSRIVYRSSPSAHFELDRSGKVSTTVITVSGSYVPPHDVKALKFTAVGAGGGAGGVDGQGAGTAACSIAGAGGGTAILFTHIIDSSYTVTIGSAGIGGAAGANPGTTGGATAVTSTNVNLSALGGLGGLGVLATASTLLNQGASGGVATGGDINITGGDSSAAGTVSGNRTAYSESGASIFSGGVKGAVNATGITGRNFGEGGGSTSIAAITTDYAGGDGYQGAVIVEEYF